MDLPLYFLEDRDPEVRRFAAWSLGAMFSAFKPRRPDGLVSVIRAVLVMVAQHDPSEVVRESAVSALSDMGSVLSADEKRRLESILEVRKAFPVNMPESAQELQATIRAALSQINQIYRQLTGIRP